MPSRYQSRQKMPRTLMWRCRPIRSKPRRKVAAARAWEGSPPDARAAAFRVQLEHMAPTPAIPEWERIASKITLHLEQVVRGDVPLDDALAALDRDVDAILEKRRSLLARGGQP